MISAGIGRARFNALIGTRLPRVAVAMLAKDPRLDEGAATNHDAGDPCPHPLGRLVVGEDIAVACSRCAGFEAHGMRGARVIIAH